MQPLVQAESADIDLFRKIAHDAQNMARALGGLQNAPSVHGLTPQEASELTAALRTAPRRWWGWGRASIKLSAKESDALIKLVHAASKSAIMIPAVSNKAVSVEGLVTALLNSGNLLDQAAKNAQPEPVK